MAGESYSLIVILVLGALGLGARWLSCRHPSPHTSTPPSNACSSRARRTIVWPAWSTSLGAIPRAPTAPLFRCCFLIDGEHTMIHIVTSASIT